MEVKNKKEKNGQQITQPQGSNNKLLASSLKTQVKSNSSPCCLLHLRIVLREHSNLNNDVAIYNFPIGS